MAAKKLYELTPGYRAESTAATSPISRKAREQALAEKEADKRQQTMAAHQLFERVTNPGLSVDRLMEGARRNQERQIEAAIGQSRQQEQQAKQQYEEYKKSEKRQEDWRKAIHDAVMGMGTPGSGLDLELGKLPTTTQNQKENELSATADYYEHQRKAAENWGVLNKDLAEIQTMPEDDRKLLETYANGQDEWFDMDVIGASIGARADLEAKYGKERTAELVEGFKRNRNQEAAQRMQTETAAHIGQKGPGAEIVHSAASVVANAVGAVSAPLGYIKELFHQTGRYHNLDPNNAGAIFNQYASTARQETAKNIKGKDGGLLRKGAAIGYRSLMVTADNVVRIAMGGGTKVGSLGLAALGSFGSTVQEASAGGATPEQAVLLGVASAGLEILTERYSIERILGEAKTGKGLKHLLKEAAKSGAIEVTEEEAAFLGNLAAEAVILRGNSSYNQQIGELVANGMSYQQARAQADRRLWNEAAQSVALSFISGGLIEGGKQALAATGNQASTAEATINKQKANGTKPEANSTDGQTGLERMAELETEMFGMIDRGELTTEEGLRRYQAVAQEWEQLSRQEGATQNATVPENATVPVGAENATTEKPTADEYIDAMAADLANKPEAAAQEQPQKITDQQIREAIAETIGLDTATTGRYNQNNNTGNASGGMNYGAENDRTAGTGDPAQRVAGVQRGDGYEVGGRGEHGRVARHSGILRVSEDLQRARSKRGLQSYDLYDTSASTQEYEQALIAGRNSDTVNGWCVTPKSAQELAEGNVRTAMNADGTVGVGVAPDGDIVAVFKNKSGGPRKALDTAMPAAIEMGGDRLDCYGEGLVTVYEGYGFIPVARVEFNPEYANDGWTPEKGNPYIYVMMHNGDNAATVTDKMHSYKISTKADLDALPTYGKDGYDDAMAYRDSLFQKRRNNTPGQGQNTPRGVPEGFEAMGAASYGFSPYTEMQARYGNIPEGENAVRPDDAPISTDGTDRVSYTARTAIGAEVTPDEFVPLIENEVVRGGFSFIPITNDRTVQHAVQSIQAEGWQTARANWAAQVRQGRAGADITATGALLYNHAVNSGNYREAMDILLDYQLSVRNSAQGLQAARILKRLTPENRLYMIRRSIQRMVEDMNLNREITIDEELARRYQETRDNAEADRILDEIARDVARQIPSTAAERFTALRYLNMLGNFRTQARNLVGNLANEGLYLAKDELAATVEALASFVSGGRFQRSKTLVRDPGTRRAAAADYENVADWISGGGRTNDRGGESDDFARRVQENRRIFRNPLLEGYRNITNWAMNNDRFGDAAFGRANYARALAGYLNARGIRTNDLSTVDRETLNAAREYAVRQAQEATFRDNNQVSEFVSRALRSRNTPAWARVIGEAVMPFRKTPANVLVRAEEFSPLGLINSAVNTVRAARGDISGAELVDGWAKSLTGTGLFAIGWALANMGYLRGGPDEDEDKAAFDKLNGLQDYALMLPDGTNLTIDAFSPTALPLLLGAQLDKVLDGTDLTFADLEGMLSTLADPMIEMSMLSGLNDTIDAIRYADNSLGQFFVNAGFNYLTQALGNTLFGQIERSTEESRMTTYIDKDSNIPAWLQRNLGKLSQKFPLWDYNQTEYIDQWGREQKNPEGIKNWLYNLLSPSYIDKAEVDQVAQELYRLNEAQTGTNVFPQSPETQISYTDSDGNRHEKYNLSMEELDKLKRTEGQTQAKMVADLIGSKDYSALSDAQKAEAVKLCYDYARELARGEVLPGYDGKSSWMEGIEGKEAAAIIGKVAGGELSDAMTALSTGWREGYTDDSGALKGLESAAKTYEALTPEMQNAVKEGLSERVAAYLEAREKGVDTETFANFYRKYWDIDQSGAGASEQAKKWAYELERAEERREITAQQKATLKNSLRFYQNLPAETKKFDQLTESGLSADEADNLGWLIQGLKIQDGYKEVRDIQKAEAIGNMSGLSEADRIAALKIYGTDAQDENLDQMIAMGYSSRDYLNAWKLIAEEKEKGGTGTKRRTINALAQMYGVSTAKATEIYEVWYPKGK